MSLRAKATCTGVNKIKSYTSGQDFHYEYSLVDISAKSVTKQMEDKIPEPTKITLVAMKDLGLEVGGDYYFDVTKV